MVKKMNTTEIVRFLKRKVEPLGDDFYGLGYRASAYLNDGTHLPCVMFRNPEKKVNQAIKRLKEERAGASIFAASSGVDGYRNMVKLYATSGNTVNDYDIARVEKSPFAFPKEILSTIQGETTMGWTGFAAKMKDGKIFGYGTSFLFEFFQLPEGYDSNDIEKIINHSYVSQTGELKSHVVPFLEPPSDYDRNSVYRERPYFECHIDAL